MFCSDQETGTGQRGLFHTTKLACGPNNFRKHLPILKTEPSQEEEADGESYFPPLHDLL